MSKFKYALMNDEGMVVAIGELDKDPKRDDVIPLQKKHVLGQIQKKDGRMYIAELDAEGRRTGRLKKAPPVKTRKKLREEARNKIESLEVVDE